MRTFATVRGWMADLGGALVRPKKMPWQKAPVPLVLLVLAATLFSGCTSSGVETETSISGAAARGDRASSGEPVAVIELPEEPARAEVGKPILFDASASRGAIRTWAWSFGDNSSLVESDAVAEHVYRVQGTYVVVLVVRDGSGRDDVDVRHVTVSGSGAPLSAPTAPESNPAAPEIQYVWEAPKYVDAFESLNVSTLPVQAAPYAASIGGTWVHADFVPDDGAMLLDALVMFQDYRGQGVCSDPNAKVAEWKYDAAGHYFGAAQECGPRVGLATQVYVGLCVEYDGHVIPADEWRQEGDVVYGDKIDDCWQRIIRLPLPV